MTTNKTVYEIVTEKVTDFLEQGVIPWRVSWAYAEHPKNYLSLRPYRGVNIMLLGALGYSENFFVNEAQIENLSSQVKKGERPHTAVYWQWRNGDDGRRFSVLHYEKVYNIAQCKGLGPVLPERILPGNPLEECKNIVKGMPDAPEIRHRQSELNYMPNTNIINMLDKRKYSSPEVFYYNLFRLLVYSTGHANRFNRAEVQSKTFFIADPLSLEDLIADIAAHYLCFHAGMVQPPQLEDKIGAIHGWLGKFSEDPKLVVYAATQAQKAIDYILNTRNEDTPKEKDTENESVQQAGEDEPFEEEE